MVIFLRPLSGTGQPGRQECRNSARDTSATFALNAGGTRGAGVALTGGVTGGVTGDGGGGDSGADVGGTEGGTDGGDADGEAGRAAEVAATGSAVVPTPQAVS